MYENIKMPFIPLAQADIDKAKTDKTTINQYLLGKYQNEINEIVALNRDFEKLSPVQICMISHGISMESSFDIFTTLDNEWLFPVYVSDTLINKTINDDTYQYYNRINTITPVADINVSMAYINLLDEENRKAISLKYVDEGADIPVGSISFGTRSIRLRKKARAVRATYEHMRRAKVDLVNMAMSAIANDIAGMERAEALDVLINGDGNTSINSAYEGAIETINTETAGVLTSRDILNAIVKYKKRTNNLTPTTLVTTEEKFVEIQDMKYDGNMIIGIDGRITFNTPQFSDQQFVLLYDDNVKKINNKDPIIFFNSDATLERIIEGDSMIKEYDRNIHNQTELNTYSINSGHGLRRPDARIALLV